jgi:hypothetical protein
MKEVLTAISMLYRSWDTGTSGLAAAILNFPLPVSRWILHNNVMKFPDPDNVGLAVGISLLSCIEADIYVHSVWQPPS